MKTYNVFYNLTNNESIKIGEFSILDSTQKFVPDFDGIKKVEDAGETILEMLKKEIVEEKIKFFNSMIVNCERFGDKISSHVHSYELRAINN